MYAPVATDTKPIIVCLGGLPVLAGMHCLGVLHTKPRVVAPVGGGYGGSRGFTDIHMDMVCFSACALICPLPGGGNPLCSPACHCQGPL